MTDWNPLDAELDRWRAAGMILPLWWRDDDAVTVTPELDRLSGLSNDLGLPVHLAVIPEGATPELAGYVTEHPHLIPVVHGWSHENHAPAGEKKVEFGAHRPLADLVDLCQSARARLRALFGDRLAPMFVPPWNRTTDDLIAQLPGCGYTMISTFKPRESALTAPGLLRVNTHLDPIYWRGGGSLADPDTLIAQVAGQLADRREGRADNGEPYGILTHHLVHDEAVWAFTETLLRHLMAGPVRVWTANMTDPKKGPADEPT